MQCPGYRAQGVGRISEGLGFEVFTGCSNVVKVHDEVGYMGCSQNYGPLFVLDYLAGPNI